MVGLSWTAWSASSWLRTTLITSLFPVAVFVMIAQTRGEANRFVLLAGSGPLVDSMVYYSPVSHYARHKSMLLHVVARVETIGTTEKLAYPEYLPAPPLALREG